MQTQSITAENGFPTAVKPDSYHPVLVTLHWLIAIMILGAVLLVQENEGGRERFEGPRGNFQGQGFQHRNSPPQDSDFDELPQAFPREGGGNIFTGTGILMILGVSILVLLIVRLIARWTTRHPEWATAGNKFFDWIGVLTHWGCICLPLAWSLSASSSLISAVYSPGHSALVPRPGRAVSTG